MKYILLFEKFLKDDRDINDQIKFVRGVSSENKEYAKKYTQCITKVGKGKITGLDLPSEFVSKLNSEKLPNGFSMGIDKDGFFIHTHRARSKSKKSIMSIPKKDIIFIDSTG